MKVKVKVKVKEIMTQELFYLRNDRHLDLVQDVMKWHHIRHIPIVDQEKRLMGLITHRDLLRVMISSIAKITEEDQRKLLEDIPVDSVMQTNLITTNPDSDLKEAAMAMIENKLGCLPVVEKNGTLVGIITEADFLKLTVEGL